jgi:two-component system nitrogen regulation response regulator GlnG
MSNARASCSSKIAMARERLLIVDDDDDLRIALADVLTDAGWIVRVAGSVEDARRVVATWEPDVVVLDYLLPDGFCDELVDALRRGPQQPFLVLVSGSNGAGEVAARHGIPHLAKPIDETQLLRALDTAA